MHQSRIQVNGISSCALARVNNFPKKCYLAKDSCGLERIALKFGEVASYRNEERTQENALKDELNCEVMDNESRCNAGDCKDSPMLITSNEEDVLKLDSKSNLDVFDNSSITTSSAPRIFNSKIEIWPEMNKGLSLFSNTSQTQGHFKSSRNMISENNAFLLFARDKPDKISKSLQTGCGYCEFPFKGDTGKVCCNTDFIHLCCFCKRPGLYCHFYVANGDGLKKVEGKRFLASKKYSEQMVCIKQRNKFKELNTVSTQTFDTNPLSFSNRQASSDIKLISYKNYEFHCQHSKIGTKPLGKKSLFNEGLRAEVSAKILDMSTNMMVK